MGGNAPRQGATRRIVPGFVSWVGAKGGGHSNHLPLVNQQIQPRILQKHAVELSLRKDGGENHPHDGVLDTTSHCAYLPLRDQILPSHRRLSGGQDLQACHQHAPCQRGDVSAGRVWTPTWDVLLSTRSILAPRADGLGSSLCRPQGLAQGAASPTKYRVPAFRSKSRWPLVSRQSPTKHKPHQQMRGPSAFPPPRPDLSGPKLPKNPLVKKSVC